VVKEIRDEPLLIRLGERIRILRQERSMTLEQLAYASELELSQIHRVEKRRVIEMRV
jgi:transcriptional regulator with XRE-family HTH domain